MRVDNHVAEYKESVITCQSCKGTGMVKITKEEIEEILERLPPVFDEDIYHQECGNCVYRD